MANDTEKWKTIARVKLRRHEGIRKYPYVDSEGYLTIGIGRNLSQVGLSSEEVDFLFENDLRRAYKIATAFVGKDFFDNHLSPLQQAALVNMAFNLGEGSLSNFKKFRAALLSKDFKRAAEEMLDSRWARQVGQRAKELAEDMQCEK